jgi:hypothetical protein
MKAYNAMIAGNAKDAIVPWAAGKPPVDATEFSTSYAWASESVNLDDPRHASLGKGFGYRQPSEAGNPKAADQVVTARPLRPRYHRFRWDNQLEPNTALVLPADTIAGIIQKALFPDRVLR